MPKILLKLYKALYRVKLTQTDNLSHLKINNVHLKLLKDTYIVDYGIYISSMVCTFRVSLGALWFRLAAPSLCRGGLRWSAVAIPAVPSVWRPANARGDPSVGVWTLRPLICSRRRSPFIFPCSLPHFCVAIGRNVVLTSWDRLTVGSGRKWEKGNQIGTRGQHYRSDTDGLRLITQRQIKTNCTKTY